MLVGASAPRAPLDGTMPATDALGRFDPHALAELNGKYQARWQALWTAAFAVPGRTDELLAGLDLELERDEDD